MFRQTLIRARAIRSILLGRPTAYRLCFSAPPEWSWNGRAYVANCEFRV